MNIFKIICSASLVVAFLIVTFSNKDEDVHMFPVYIALLYLIWK